MGLRLKNIKFFLFGWKQRKRKSCSFAWMVIYRVIGSLCDRRKKKSDKNFQTNGQNHQWPRTMKRSMHAKWDAYITTERTKKKSRKKKKLDGFCLSPFLWQNKWKLHVNWMGFRVSFVLCEKKTKRKSNESNANKLVKMACFCNSNCRSILARNMQIDSSSNIFIINDDWWSTTLCRRA